MSKRLKRRKHKQDFVSNAKAELVNMKNKSTFMGKNTAPPNGNFRLRLRHRGFCKKGPPDNTMARPKQFKSSGKEGL